MKSQYFLLIILALVACNNSKNNEANTTPVPVVINTTPKQENIADETDSRSSATSKPNEVLFNGMLIVSPEGQATVTIPMGGTVKNTHLLSGNLVKKGEVLFTLVNPDFIDLQQSYLESKAQLEFLEAEYNRQTALSSEQAASQKKLQQSKADFLSMKSKHQAASAQLEILGINLVALEETGIRTHLEVKSPISGYMGNVRINPGKHINAGESICDIINKDNTLLRLIAYEKDLKNIQQGANVEFSVNGFGSKQFKGTLISIGQQVDEASRSLELYVKVASREELFRPGMYVTARITPSSTQ